MSTINEQYAAAFVHVPKTGGRSIKTYFGGVGSGHRSAAALLSGRSIPFSFGFVRNPYDRLVAVFHAALQHGGRWPRMNSSSFASFVRQLRSDWQVEPHAWPMARFLCNGEGDVLVDFVGRFERLEHDWRKVCQRIGMEYQPLPKTHQTERNTWQAYYTPELSAIVDDLYAEDFQAFDYDRLPRSETEPLPFVSCVCPTYKRPHLLQNALACFSDQAYPKSRCELVIWDDAAQFQEQSGENWRLISSAARIPTLPDKYNALISRIDPRAEVIVIWEDDEVFLPQHLRTIAKAWNWSGRHPKSFFAPAHVWSTCGEQLGSVHLENALGRFHSSWAFTPALFRAVDGYPRTDRLIFDQQMGRKLRDTADAVVHYEDPSNPTFVYRWGNGVYHGSQGGDAGYARLWQELESRPAPRIGRLFPHYDNETRQILKKLHAL